MNRLRHEAYVPLLADSCGACGCPQAIFATGLVPLASVMVVRAGPVGRPAILCNPINDPALQTIRQDLAQALDTWMARTNDCFASGTFPQPPGRSPELRAREHLCAW